MSVEDRHKSLIIKALSIVPALAVVAVVISSYFARAPDIIAARIYGGPPSPHGFAWRVNVSLRDRGFYEPVPNVPLSLHAGDQHVEGTTNDEGAWEARLPLSNPKASEVHALVRRRDTDQLLLSQPVPVHPPTWKSSFRRAQPLLPGRRSGSLDVELFLLRSFLASTYQERLLIRVTREGSPVPSASLTAHGVDVRTTPEDVPATNDRGTSWITLRSSFPAPSLVVEAKDASGETGRVESVLPVRTGAMWVDPTAQMKGTLAISSPVRHRYAYVTLFTEHARWFGSRVALEDDGKSGAKGSMTLPPLPNQSVWALISPDPPGTGAEADLLGWPMLRAKDTPVDAARVSTTLLADGMPQALAEAKERAHSGRVRAMVILALAALIETLLLWSRARHAKRELERLLASEADVDEAVSRALLGGSRFWLKMMIAVFLVSLGFSALAFVLWMGGL